MNNRLTIAMQKNGRLSDESQKILQKSGVKFRSRDGKLLIRSNSFPIDIDNQGIYFLKIFSEEGIVIKKVVIN